MSVDTPLINLEGPPIPATESLIDRAAMLAVALHYGQTRKSPRQHEPYHLHCYRVARRVAMFLAQTPLPDAERATAIAASYLHDTLEDVEGLSAKQLIGLLGDPYGVPVVQLVCELTNPPRKFGNRQQRMREVNRKIEEASMVVKLIKAVDRLDNLSEWPVGFSISFMEKYLNESSMLCEAILANVDDTPAGEAVQLEANNLSVRIHGMKTNLHQNPVAPFGLGGGAQFLRERDSLRPI